MKKIITVFLMLALVLSTVACNNNKGNESTKAPTSDATTVVPSPETTPAQPDPETSNTHTPEETTPTITPNTTEEKSSTALIPETTPSETPPETTPSETPPESTSEDMHLGDPDYSSEYTNGLWFKLNEDNNTYMVLYYYGGTDTDVVIPRIYKGRLVTAIGPIAFQFTDVTSVVIPDSITSIEASAFSDCKNLQGIDIPSSVTYIGDYAFSGCKSIESITVPENVTYIGEGAFPLFPRG